MRKPTKCALCKQTGGRFRFRDGKGDWVHVKCSGSQVSRDGTHKNWPLTTSHILGPNHAPMTFDNLRQLRSAERNFGIMSEAYNMDSSNREA